jgi:hypothetical protein
MQGIEKFILQRTKSKSIITTEREILSFIEHEREAIG